MIKIGCGYNNNNNKFTLALLFFLLDMAGCSFEQYFLLLRKEIAAGPTM